MKTKLIFIGIVLITLILYLPSFNVFYTNDDFFLLKISQANNISEFINFFNFTKGPDGLGMYRPLTIQVFYFLAHSLFNLNPFPMHVVVFFVFTLLLYSIFLLSRKLFGYLKVKNIDNPSLLVVFLYAVSATHFGHMYYLATFQEVAMTLFSVLCIYFYLHYLDKKKGFELLLSLSMFVLALLSKENSVVMPGLLFATYLFRQVVLKERIVLIVVIKHILPFAVILSIYLYFHFFVYGLATGDSYIWDFSVRKSLNTLAWYLLWSFNIPEMFVDFFGPGFNVNPNLMKFWSKETTTIMLGFAFDVAILMLALYKSLKLINLKYVLIYSVIGFVLSLLTVLFLPIHKFSFYLTLPLLWVVLPVIYILNNNKVLIMLFLTAWLLTSVATSDLTRITHWIVRGQEIAIKVHNYVKMNTEELKGKTILFVDTKEDESLPWSPTENVKNTLSESNYFNVFHKDTIDGEFKYFNSINNSDTKYQVINSRRFLGY